MDKDWRKWASCIGHDPELWFPKQAESGIEARRICYSCPVRLECLEDALQQSSYDDADGIRGGMRPRQRNAMRMGRVDPETEMDLPRCVNGHDLTGDALSIRTGPGGRIRRSCRVCVNEKSRRSKARLKAQRVAS